MLVTARNLPRADDGVVVAVITRRDDVEDKLVVAVGGTWDVDAIASAVRFQEQGFDSQVHASDSSRGSPCA